MRYSDEKIKQALTKLPQQVQEAIQSIDLIDNVEAIANKHELLIWQVDELHNQVKAIMCGLEKPSNLQKNLETDIEIDSSTAEELIRELNIEVFQKTREKLAQSAQKKEEPTDNLDREHVLHEIENPTPIKSVINPVIITPKAPAPIVKQPTQASKPLVESANINILENKLTQTVISSTEATTVAQSTPKVAPEPKKYSSDPYREPIQ